MLGANHLWASGAALLGKVSSTSYAAVALGQTFAPISLGQMVDLHHALVR